MLVLVGIAAVVLISISDISYVRAILKGYAQPHRVTWGIFLATALVTFSSQASLGASDSLFVFGWFVIVNATIFALSLLPGKGISGVTSENAIALFLVVVSLILWLMTGPWLALICILVADTIGIVLTVVKTWRDPWSEPRLMWGLGSIAAVFNIVAVGSLDLFLLLAPLHLLVCDVVMISVIIWRRRKVPRPIPAV